VAHDFKEWLQTTLEAGTIELLCAAAVDLADSQAWGHVPHVIEGDEGKLSSPFHGDTDSKEESKELIEAVFTAIEAAERALPDTVEGVGAIRLTENIVESNLYMVIKIIGISVHQIKFVKHTHLDLLVRDSLGTRCSLLSGLCSI